MKSSSFLLLLTLSFLVIILPSYAQSCSDSDGGSNPYAAGICISPVNSKSDLCSSASSLREANCYTSRYFNKTSCVSSYISCNVKCKADLGKNFSGTCSLGKCNCEDTSCKDTDGGMSPFVFGSVTLNKQRRNDTCIGARYLLERSCRNYNSYSSKVIDCRKECNNAFGLDGICSNNACQCASERVLCGDGIVQPALEEECDPPGAPLGNAVVVQEICDPENPSSCEPTHQPQLICNSICQIEIVEQHPYESVFDTSIICNLGNGVFVNDRSPNSTGLTRNYTHTKNITVASQFQNWTAVPRGNMSCAPTCTGSGMEYWNRTFPGLMRNMSLFNATNTLHRLMRTNETTGTSIRDFLNGAAWWINRSGYAKNMSITLRGNIVNGNSSFLHHGVNTTTITGSDNIFNPLDINTILEEFITKNEFVMLIIEVPGGFHVVAIHSISNVPNSNGNYDVALMDPATGEIIETEISPNGDICTEYNPDGSCRAVTTLQGLFSISNIND